MPMMSVLSDVMFNIIMLSLFVLSVIRMSVGMPSVINPRAIRLSVAAPFFFQKLLILGSFYSMVCPPVLALKSLRASLANKPF